MGGRAPSVFQTEGRHRMKRQLLFLGLFSLAAGGLVLCVFLFASQPQVKTDTAELTGLCIFSMIFFLQLLFGALWVKDAEESTDATSNHIQIHTKFEELAEVLESMGVLISELERIAQGADGQQTEALTGLYESLDEDVSQIKMLTINGTLEATRPGASPKVFYEIMQQMNQLAEHSRANLKRCQEQPSFDWNGVKTILAQIDGLMKFSRTETASVTVDVEPVVSSTSHGRASSG